MKGKDFLTIWRIEKYRELHNVRLHQDCFITAHVKNEPVPVKLAVKGKELY